MNLRNESEIPRRPSPRNKSRTGFSLSGFLRGRAKNLHPAKESRHALITPKGAQNDSQPREMRFGIPDGFDVRRARPLQVSSSHPQPPHQPRPQSATSAGLWHYESTGASEPVAPDNLIPPMTPWAKVRFDAERPGYGSEAFRRRAATIPSCNAIRQVFLASCF